MFFYELVNSDWVICFVSLFRMIELMLFLSLNKKEFYRYISDKAKDLVKSYDFLGETHLDFFKESLISETCKFILINTHYYSKEYLLTELSENVIIETLGENYLSPEYWRKYDQTNLF